VITKTEQEIISNWQDITSNPIASICCITSNPIASICCITYNHEKYIAQALDSILTQEGKYSYEILIGEDCSTDKTRELLMNYQEKFPHIIKLMLHDDNIGMMKNFIGTLQSCSGKYIAILEGDDYWTDSYKLQKQIHFLENNPEYIITYTSSLSFIKKNQVLGKSGGTEVDLSAEDLLKAPPLNTLTTCFRNIITSFPPEIYASKLGDLFIWSLLGEHGKGKFLDDIEPSMYRIHEDGVFSEKSKKQKYEMALITDVALFTYYNRIHKNMLADFFKYRIIDYWMTSESLTKLLLYILSLKYTKMKNKLRKKLTKLFFWTK